MDRPWRSNLQTHSALFIVERVQINNATLLVGMTRPLNLEGFSSAFSLQVTWIQFRLQVSLARGRSVPEVLLVSPDCLTDFLSLVRSHSNGNGLLAWMKMNLRVKISCKIALHWDSSLKRCKLKELGNGVNSRAVRQTQQHCATAFNQRSHTLQDCSQKCTQYCWCGQESLTNDKISIQKGESRRIVALLLLEKKYRELPY